MTETPTERAARAHYVQEAKRLDHLTSRSLEMWNDPKMAPWRALKIASMAVAIAAYAEAVREDTCRDDQGNHRGPGRNGCCLRGLMGVGEACPDCPAKAEESAAKRERAIEVAARDLSIAHGLRMGQRRTDAVFHWDSAKARKAGWVETETAEMKAAIAAYQRVMAEPDAAQPHKEGA